MKINKQFSLLSTKTLILVFVSIAFVFTSCNSGAKKTDQTKDDTGLVDVLSIDSTLVLDLKYATEDNFLGKALYEAEKCYLLKPAAEMLANANDAARTHGLRLKIFDGYRPHSVQKQMWEMVPNPMYVADPEKGSHHNRGCAVDVTLIDSLGNEIEMPTGFDDFTEKAHHDYMELPDNVIKNRELLKKIMVDAGFIPLSSEWWHYSTPGCSENKILDMSL